jgi:site-specific recombinase XerD
MSPRPKFNPPFVTQPKGRPNYVYRRTVPPDVRGALGRVNWVIAFRRGTPLAQIEIRAQRLAAEHDSLIARARAGDTLDAATIAKIEAEAHVWRNGDKSELHELMAFLADQLKALPGNTATAAVLNVLEHGHYEPETMTLAMARDKRGGERSEKPVDAAMVSFAPFGGDKDVRQIDDDDVARWIKAELARKMAPNTVKRRLQSLHAICRFAFRRLKIEKPNPFGGHADLLKKARASASDRLPFNRKMLDLIDSYVASSKRVKPETRNIIKMLRNTGAGPAEIGGLALGDVVLKGDIPFIWIRSNKLRGLKADARDRRVPLIGEALDAAKDAVNRAKPPRGKDKDEAPLFAGFGRDGRGADSISAKLNKAIRAAKGMPVSPRLVAYSYRHNIKEALRSSGAADHVQRRILGHAGQGVADRYGSAHGRLVEARDALDKALNGVDSKGVAFLGNIDDAEYSAREQFKEAAE